MTIYNQNSFELDQIDQAVNNFAKLEVDEQLALLWFIYVQVGKLVTPAAPDAASPEIAGGLFEQVKAKPHEEQLEIMRDLAQKKDTLISREYGSLSANSKLAFWLFLGEGMEENTIIPMPKEYQLSPEGKALLSSISLSEFQQQITILRSVVVDMGAEPASQSV